METNRNPGGLLIGALICIFIGIASCQIAYETYEDIRETNWSLDDDISFDAYDWRQSDWKTDFWYKKRTRLESNRYAILYTSSFIFSISLCCFTSICIKSFS
tara:strand:- start:370 stop:675 length:306 start_codon:yes stop_codon:yes gene_type:complete